MSTGTSGSGGGLEFSAPDQASGHVYGATKLGNGEPDYSSVTGTESWAGGLHVWEVCFDRIGNTRVGIARLPLPLDSALHSKKLVGEVYFVDYEGVAKHNEYGTLRTIKTLLAQNVDFANGDRIRFSLDLRDNARHAASMPPPIAGEEPPELPKHGKLTAELGGRVFLLASDLAGEFCPIFQMDNIHEALTIGFDDGHLHLADADKAGARARSKLELPSAKQR